MAEHGDAPVGGQGALATLSVMAQMLDGLSVALCAFDAQDRTLLWNRSFVRYFPEHARHVHVGEPYADNLRRFYRERLDPSEQPALERYVRAGIERHRTQQAPFSFEHRGRHLTVSSLSLPDGTRVRMWREDVPSLPVPADPAEDATLAAALAPMEASLLDHVADGVSVIDASTTIVWTNEAFLAMYGFESREDALGLTFAAAFAHTWQTEGPPTQAARMHDGLSVLRDQLRFPGAAFELALPGDRWSRVIARVGLQGRHFLVHVDITLLKRQQHELLAAEARARESEAQLNRKSSMLELTLERMDQGLMMVNADQVVELCNRRAMELLDLPEALMASRPSFQRVLQYQVDRGEFDRADPAVMGFISAGGILARSHSYERERPDGRVIEIRSVPLDGGGLVRTYTDISERREQERRIRFLARHDGLTGLINREVFLEQLGEAMEAANAIAGGPSVCFLDLDRFKSINDSHGHAVGDQILIEAASRMTSVVRDRGVVARLGGDEFGVLLGATVNARAVAQQLFEAFRATGWQHAGTVHDVAVSIGVATFPNGGSDAHSLLRSADAAMYLAKATGDGRGGVRVFGASAASALPVELLPRALP
ncbi:MAG: PAS-domain containing protein [Pseudomonadota bacterium]|nr:PAS-domain containing protein [Pseudomonadota bacterium]MDQ7999601.1 PAS-domain containing protein [Pseudomonadota bacterium]